MAMEDDELSRFLLMMGLGMMGAKTLPEGLSRGGMFGIQGADNLRESKDKRRLVDAKLKEEALQAQKAEYALSQAKSWDDAMKGLQGGVQAQQGAARAQTQSVVNAPEWASSQMNPYGQNAAPSMAAKPPDQNAVLRDLALRFPAQVKQIFEAQKAGEDKVYGEPQKDADGKVFVLTDRGPRYISGGFVPRDKLVNVDMGGSIGMRSEYDPKIVASLPKGMSPEGRDASNRGWAAFNRGELRTDIPTGKPGETKVGFVRPDGVTDVPGAGTAQKVPPVEYTKQQTGIANTRDAIETYAAALKSASPADYVMPNSRAKIGTKYNNMMLQAKEAYNLGVLNGPDYMILQEVVANPNSLRGMSISKGALLDQTKTLDAILEKMGQTTAATHNQPAPKPRESASALTPAEEAERQALRKRFNR